MKKHTISVHLGLLGALYFLFSSPLFTAASYEPAYGVSHHESSYAAPPVHHGHSAGSYYHYHVPLVGQQQQQVQPPIGWGWPHHKSDDHSFLWPLLILLGLPLLFLPLLPLFLIPLGLSLLALLLPLLMGGGMMMMMMMMMMMPMGFNNHRIGSQEARQFGSLVLNDISLLVSKYARSLDLDQCPQAMACQAGSILLPLGSNGTQVSTAKALMNYVVNKAVPQGRLRDFLVEFKEAFWARETGSCSIYRCSPKFHLYTGTQTEYSQPEHHYDHLQESQVVQASSIDQGVKDPSKNESASPETPSSINRQWVDYYKKLQKYYKKTGKKVSKVNDHAQTYVYPQGSANNL